MAQGNAQNIALNEKDRIQCFTIIVLHNTEMGGERGSRKDRWGGRGGRKEKKRGRRRGKEEAERPPW